MKTISYLLLAVALVLAIVFFVQSQGNSRETGDSDRTEQMVSGELISGNFTLDTESSYLEWMGEKKIINSSHAGSLKFKSGELTLEEGAYTMGDFVVDMNSLSIDPEDSGGDSLLNHLISDDFFSIEEHPEASLVITGFDEESDHAVKADLTIKNITNPVSLIISKTEMQEDENMINIEGSMEFDRSEYDIRYGSETFFENLGDKAIKDTVKIDFFITAGVVSEIVE